MRADAFVILLMLIVLIAIAIFVPPILGCWIDGGYVSDFSGNCLGRGLSWDWLGL